MPDDSARLLGFAFACADLLFELEPDGRVTFALGAANQLLGQDPTALVGQSWRNLISEDDAPVVAAFLQSLGKGDRRGPIRIALKPVGGRKLKRYVGLSACCLPQLAPRISCALTVHAAASTTIEPAGPHGLHTIESLSAVADAAIKHAAQSGVDLNMELVELAGLKQAADALGDSQSAEVLGRVAAAIRAESIDGSSAAQLEDDRYAFVRQRAESSDRVAERLSRAMSDVGLPQVRPTLDSLELGVEGAGDSARMLRMALDRFIAGGAAGMAGGSLSGMIKQTVTEASRVKVQVASRRFSMAYQPVVNLQTGATDHYEALVRLGGNDSPTESILMAENMDIIHDLDTAVVQTVIAEMKKPGRSTLRLAANISARSLMMPAFTAKLLQMVHNEPSIRGRLILEITESAIIDDLPAADALVRRLRKEGCKLALDDFGAGAASFDYLRAIAVDEVKIDGRYIRELSTAGGRNTAVVQHLTDLCRELKVSTVAEMVENEETADMLRKIGVDFGQGFLFGRPAPEPTPAPIRRAPVVARRTGTTDSWG
ncbi:MAG TPA: EAL domain-containing protein [Caulobacteraceae bacterium]|nr:EAL domain-containing protein [Caulobacteraceae bacterium]